MNAWLIAGLAAVGWVLLVGGLLRLWYLTRRRDRRAAELFHLLVAGLTPEQREQVCKRILAAVKEVREK